MMTRFPLSLSAALLLATLLAGCGQKGPLTYPPRPAGGQPVVEQQTAEQPANEQNDGDGEENDE